VLITDDDHSHAAIHQPPEYCEYAGAKCDQVFAGAPKSAGLFLYPSQPELIASTIESAKHLLADETAETWLSWRDIKTEGQVIFCRICKAIRFSKLIAADVTTLNFNLLFEVGYALGLRQPVLPLKDTSFVSDKKEFDELGLLDTIGYLDFRNSADLAATIRRRNVRPMPQPNLRINQEQPLFVMKSHVYSEGMVRLMSSLKKSGLFFRTFDPRETSRLSLMDAQKQVASSLGVIVHLASPDRAGARVHNARCAFVAGLALAQKKHVLMLQEGEDRQPIDYRDIVRSYQNPGKVPDLLISFYRPVVQDLQESRFVATALPLTSLERVDLGDLAAENEIKALTSYFFPTGQFNEAKRGRARLVVGRKGAGKTAIFYGIRTTYKPSRAHLVLDLKPEGHQLVKLRETVLNELSPGVQQHVLTAFWNYLLLVEIAHKIVTTESNLSYRDKTLREAFLRVQASYGEDPDLEQGDFSERLLRLVEEIIARRRELSKITGTPEVTRLVYSKDISKLSKALSDYLSVTKKEDIWLLFDNLDKGWPVHGAETEDILLLRSLLEATRKLQRQFELRGTDCHTVLFMRNDIYEHLLRQTCDRGKDTVILLDWNDPEAFKEIIRRRIMHSTNLRGTFEQLWPQIFPPQVLGEESFGYILRRTLMRPRDVLRFCRECIDVAVNRGHEQVKEQDILRAEKAYSEDALVDITHELGDINQRFADVPYAFIGARAVLSEQELYAKLADSSIDGKDAPIIKNLLLWFAFLGLRAGLDQERYSYEYQHDPKKMERAVEGEFVYCIHPAFRKALECE